MAPRPQTRAATLWIGQTPFHPPLDPVAGRPVTLEGQPCYQITNYDRLRPFFLSVVSSADLWMFISSTGALTAGRRNPDLALFPYYTEDKIHDSAGVTGPLTIFRVRRGDRTYLWEPFSERFRGAYRVQRNLCKNLWGNQLAFEETNADLGLTFRYRWSNSPRFGFVRQACLVNSGRAPVRVRLLDGLQNLMPWGVGSQFQSDKSVLLDAYKRSELLSPSGLALFRLSSIPIDRPEPAEALRTTVAWSVGLPACRRLLSAGQVHEFREHGTAAEENDVRGQRGAYLLVSEVALAPGATQRWLIVADVAQGPSDVAELDRLLRRPARAHPLVMRDVDRGTEELRKIIARADGLQQTAQPIRDARHANNVLANVMRGGIFDQGYFVEPDDLHAAIRHANRDIASRHAGFFRRLPSRLSYHELVARADATADPQLDRLCREYLPLTFSRRHGDPSRPWNRFSIASRTPEGRRELNYEGNWRDLFQNWEALAVSFPGFLPGIIARFVSASTADGYNPYRITRDGIDWEVVDPSDPWAHIGYWGDHQLIYLLRLLELLHRHDPATLRSFLTRDRFAYANVPYRIKPYADLLADPKNTVTFAPEIEAIVRRRVEQLGADGKLLWDANGQVQLVNLTEKLLVSALAKLANFIPEAGIWLNTQRPEWNDANNALVGQGTSMVTLFHLRRYLAFFREILAPLAQTPIPLSIEVVRFWSRVRGILELHRSLLRRRLTDRDRRRVLDDLGQTGSAYRQRLYQRGLSGEVKAVRGAQLVAFIGTVLDWLDHSITANRRPDGLYHAYNLVRFDQPRTLPIRRLYEMLEGQVAALGSDCLSPAEAASLLAALRHSAMYREDQRSYLLYPDRNLPRFTERNILSARDVATSRLLRVLLREGDRSLIEQDAQGRCHFSGSLTNAHDIRHALDRLAARGHAALVRRESALILGLFKRLFDHEAFTGRSGTFFAYEGLGSIYWHMVSKLLLAVQETYVRAVETGTTPTIVRELARRYHDVRAGLGDQKSPAVYGGFPMDPYSHTPAGAGARQPGLTGQVKEDILCRFGELGVQVARGCLSFQPRLLQPDEFTREPSVFEYFDVAEVRRQVRLPRQSLAFTYCQVPIVYQQAGSNRLTIVWANGAVEHRETSTLDPATSRAIFDRTGTVARLVVRLGRQSARTR